MIIDDISTQNFTKIVYYPGASNITIDGAIVTIAVPPLGVGRAYQIQIEEGFFESFGRRLHIGIFGVDWTFVTQGKGWRPHFERLVFVKVCWLLVGAVAPNMTSSIPANEQQNVLSNLTTIELIYSENVQRGAGIMVLDGMSSVCTTTLAGQDC